MPEYKPEELRDQLLTPLTVLLSEFSQGIARMESLQKADKLPNNVLALRAVEAIGAINKLKKFRRELNGKLDAASDGTLEEMERRRIYMASRRKVEVGGKGNKRRKVT